MKGPRERERNRRGEREEMVREGGLKGRERRNGHTEKMEGPRERERDRKDGQERQ